jgi:membrane protease YdiL (CAAX protease family)
MSNTQENPLFRHGQNPWIMLLVLLLIALAGVLLIGQVLAFVAALIMIGDLAVLQEVLQNPTAYPEHRVAILLVQGLSSFGGFIIAPLIFYYAMIRGNILQDFVKLSSNTGIALFVTVLMVFSFMIVNTVFIEWNANLKLPDFALGFERWASELEDQLAELTNFMTEFESTGYFLGSIVIIAVIPGIGEELLFRGFLQNILRKISKNSHVAVWVTAFLFSAIHFQFYGFVPRMLLGALFGYLYLWSGNLLVPIVAHFVNNFVSLLALFVYQKGLTNFDAESTDALPTMYVLIFAMFFLVLLVYFKSALTGRRTDIPKDSDIMS